MTYRALPHEHKFHFVQFLLHHCRVCLEHSTIPQLDDSSCVACHKRGLSCTARSLPLTDCIRKETLSYLNGATHKLNIICGPSQWRLPKCPEAEPTPPEMLMWKMARTINMQAHFLAQPTSNLISVAVRRASWSA